MKILYLGDSTTGCTSLHRAEALRRIGHIVVHVDAMAQFKWDRWRAFFHFRTGYRFLAKRIYFYVLKEVALLDSRFDVIWVDCGDGVSVQLLSSLRHNYGAKIINYNCDDITGGRDGGRWYTLKKAIHLYDLCVVMRPLNLMEYPKLGARRLMRVFMSADEIAHAPREITPEIFDKWKSEVVFIGTWMPERGPFMLELVRRGVPLSIWGNRWKKAPEWPLLRDCWRGPALTGDNYAYAIQCAKINLGLLSKGNRDLHTQRSAEIPALGALLCAERTSEHLELYEEGKEALFWNNAIECAEVLKKWLIDDAGCRRIAAAGQNKLLSSELRNEVVVRRILASL